MNGNNAHENHALGEGKRDSPEECQQLCQQTQGCVVFTFRPNNRECWLKHTKTGGRRSSGAISGDKYCEGKFFEGLQYIIT